MPAALPSGDGTQQLLPSAARRGKGRTQEAQGNGHEGGYSGTAHDIPGDAKPENIEILLEVLGTA